MRSFRCLLFACFWFVMEAPAQQSVVSLTGHVFDAASRKPVPFSTVYINNSTRGTTADSNGVYHLTNVPLGDVEIVASALGYKAARQGLRLISTRTRTIDLVLDPTGNALSAVTVTARHSRVWIRQFRQFSRELLGSRPMARECRITNENVLSFTEEKGRLTAQAAEPLVIENLALGYRLFYDLLHFDVYRNRMHFAGAARFEEIPTTDARQQAKWRANRLKAYEGSLRHLMSSLLSGTHEQDGYVIYKTPLLIQNDQMDAILPRVRTVDRQRISPQQASALFRPGELAFERRFVSEDAIEVYYDRIYTRNSPYGDSPAAYSVLLLPDKEFSVTTTGAITQPKGLDVRGYLGNDRLATLLPADWMPADKETLVAIDIKAGRPVKTDGQADSLRAERRRQRSRTAPLVYVHTDKSLYATGDHLWLSAYVLDPVRYLPMLGRSGKPMHVELIAPDGRSIVHQWLPLTDGRVGSELWLSDTLRSGTYRLRAYTDADSLTSGPGFEGIISILSSRQSGSHNEQPARAENPTSPAASPGLASQQPDVQFLAEGGRWLVGVPGRFGIKALKPDGRGFVLSGRIVDDTGAEVTRFTTNRLGMGHVSLSPQPGRSYVAVFESPMGVQHRTALPPAETEGIALSADILSDSSRLWVSVRATGRFAEQPVSIALYNQELLVYRETWQVRKGELQFALPATALLPGVSRLTLSNASGQPLAERLVFVPERNSPLQMRVVKGKSRYASRDTMAVGLQLRDADNYPVVATWSASVTDADQLPDDSTTTDFRTYLLLTSGLRGPIESPTYYLDNEHLSDVDDLLLTQGWRRLPAPQLADSTAGWAVSGRVRDARGNVVSQKTVMLSFEFNGQKLVRGIPTNEQGEFRMNGLLIPGKVQLKAWVPDLPKATITFDSPGRPFASPAAPVLNEQALLTYLNKARIRQTDDPAYYRDSSARQLAEVIVRANKPSTDRLADKQFSMHGDADAILTVDDNNNFTNLFELMRGRLPGVNIVEVNGEYSVTIRGLGSFGNNSPLYLLDGVYTNYEMIRNVDPRTISRVELLKNAGTAGIYGARAGSGVIAIYSRSGKETPEAPPISAETMVWGLASPREFYVPRYKADQTASQPDHRDVLYWNPIGYTDADGLARLMVPLNDTAQRVRIVMQGLTNEGAPFSFVWILPVR
ncbi:carboxypeptidase regulatory-like domain-containing protein [Spirosoma knui]